MELDELKSSWRALDERLTRTDARIDRLAAAVAAGKVSSSLEWLRRRTRLFLCPLAAVPFGYVSLCRRIPDLSSTALSVTMGLFLCTMLFRQVFLLVLLERIRPERQSVRDLCRAVLGFRRCYLWGVVAGVALALPLLALLGCRLGTMPDSDALLTSFAVGLTLGVAVGVRVFRRMLGRIDSLRDALRDE